VIGISEKLIQQDGCNDHHPKAVRQSFPWPVKKRFCQHEHQQKFPGKQLYSKN